MTTSEILLKATNDIEKNKDYTVCAILAFIESIRILDENRLEQIVKFTQSISTELLKGKSI